MNARARRRMRGPAALIAAAITCVTGCASVPTQRVLPEGFVPAGTPVDVRLLWDADRLAAIYNHTTGGMTAASAQNPLLFVLLLPVSLTVDAGIYASNTARAREAQRLADSVTGLPDRATIERGLATALRAELGWVAADMAPDVTPASPDSAIAAPAPWQLTIEPVVALRKDAGALLFAFSLTFCRLQGAGQPSACADEPPLAARILVHSDALPDASGGAASSERIATNVQYWIADDAAHLKQGFSTAALQLATALRIMREHAGPPGHNSMTITRALFPYFYGGDMPVRDLDLVATLPDGRRVLRSRLEPVRNGGVGEDVSANVWFSVPAAPDGDTSSEEALIEFMYGWNARSQQQMR